MNNEDLDEIEGLFLSDLFYAKSTFQILVPTRWLLQRESTGI